MVLAFEDHAGASSAPPLVFLHGAGLNGWMWDAQVAELAEFRRVVIDLPGHGGSSDVAWVSIDAAAALVARTIRDVVGGPVILVGLSLGADVGLRLLASAPELVYRALLTGMVVRPVHGAVRWMQNAFAPMVAQRSFHRLAGKTGGMTGERLQQWVDEVPPMRVADYRLIVDEIFAGVSLDGLETVTVPTLALAGAKEPKAARDSVELIAARMPGATARVMPGVGHTWNVEAPELFAATVREWVAAGEQRAGEPHPGE